MFNQEFDEEGITCSSTPTVEMTIEQRPVDAEVEKVDN